MRYLSDISDFDKQDILDWWDTQAFNLEIPEHLGNCVFCVHKGANKLALAARDEPEMADAFMEMIASDSVHRRPTREMPPEIMYRDHQSLRSIIDSYQDVSRDDIAKTIRSAKQFDSGSCSESCEAVLPNLDLFNESQEGEG